MSTTSTITINHRKEPMRRVTALVIIVLLFLIALPAAANHAENLTVDCEGWSVNFLEFNFTDHELLVTVNGLEVYFADNPPDGDFTLSGPLPEGIDGTVILATFWRHLQVNLEGPTVTVQLNCVEDTTTTAQVTTTAQQTTTTTAAPCPPGLIHQPPLCVAATTLTSPPATTTTTSPPAELPFTGAEYAVLAIIAALFAGAGIATLRRAQKGN